jgi:hypothetical protein
VVPDCEGDAVGLAGLDGAVLDGAEVEGAADADRPKIADMMSPKMLMTDAPEV